MVRKSLRKIEPKLTSASDDIEVSLIMSKQKRFCATIKPLGDRNSSVSTTIEALAQIDNYDNVLYTTIRNHS